MIKTWASYWPERHCRRSSCSTFKKTNVSKISSGLKGINGARRACCYRAIHAFVQSRAARPGAPAVWQNFIGSRSTRMVWKFKCALKLSRFILSVHFTISPEIDLNVLRQFTGCIERKFPTFISILRKLETRFSLVVDESDFTAATSAFFYHSIHNFLPSILNQRY